MVMIRAVFFDANGILYFRPAAAADAVVARDAIALFPRVIPMLATLRGRGFILGVITDTDVPSAEKLRWFHARGLTLAWDVFVNSEEEGVCKPHPAIYRAALARGGVRADEALFVGHAAHELAGARAVGMATVACHADAGAVGDYRVARFAELPDLPPLREDVRR
ncbi:MAG TPA: HAD family hydrolase [Thermomicrobiales bacterium]|jgi:putative hydrolase of the HAD superfamily